MATATAISTAMAASASASTVGNVIIAHVAFGSAKTIARRSRFVAAYARLIRVDSVHSGSGPSIKEAVGKLNMTGPSRIRCDGYEGTRNLHAVHFGGIGVGSEIGRSGCGDGSVSETAGVMARPGARARAREGGCGPYKRGTTLAFGSSSHSIKNVFTIAATRRQHSTAASMRSVGSLTGDGEKKGDDVRLPGLEDLGLRRGDRGEL